MEEQLRKQCLEVLQFYEIVVCGLRAALKATLFDNEILDVARTLARTRHELKEQAENIRKKIMELKKKKDQAIDDVNLIVIEIKALVEVLLRVLNYGDESDSLEHAVEIFLKENEKMLPKIKIAIQILNFENEVLEVKQNLEILLDRVEMEKGQVLANEKLVVAKERLKAYGTAFFAISGRFY